MPYGLSTPDRDWLRARDMISFSFFFFFFSISSIAKESKKKTKKENLHFISESKIKDQTYPDPHTSYTFTFFVSSFSFLHLLTSLHFSLRFPPETPTPSPSTPVCSLQLHDVFDVHPRPRRKASIHAQEGRRRQAHLFGPPGRLLSRRQALPVRPRPGSPILSTLPPILTS